jgi:hypothetical protein
MNYGPLQFAAYLARRARTGERRDSATVEAARAAAPVERAQLNRLAIVPGSNSLSRVARAAQIDAVSVFEAVATHSPGASHARWPVTVAVKTTQRPVVLVLSAQRSVQWKIEISKGAAVSAVLLSGSGESSVVGAGDAPVTSIGGFGAFKRGSAEFKHLESEVMRCTGRCIDTFRSVSAGKSFEF